jgi:hypothetical protein
MSATVSDCPSGLAKRVPIRRGHVRVVDNTKNGAKRH